MSAELLREAADVVIESWPEPLSIVAANALATWLNTHAADDCRGDDCPAVVFAKAVLGGAS